MATPPGIRPPTTREARVNAVFDALRVVHVTNTQVLGGTACTRSRRSGTRASATCRHRGSASKFGIGDITIDPL